MEAEDRIHEVEDRMVEINEAEREKELKERRTTSEIIGVPEEEEKKKGHEKIFEEIIFENFAKMGKEVTTQVQETERVQNRINPRQNTQDTY